MLDEKIILQQWTTDKYGYAILNPDWSLVGWGWGQQATPYTMLAYYDSDTNYNYEYYAEALPWTSIDTPQWRCFRVKSDKNTWNFTAKEWAWTNFNHKWDETTVKGLTYN